MYTVCGSSRFSRREKAHRCGLFRQIARLVQERAKLLSEVPSLVDFFFTDRLEYESGLLVGKLEKGQAIEVLKLTLHALEGIREWRAGDLEISGQAACRRARP